MRSEEKAKEEDMLDKIYCTRQLDMELENKQDRKKLKSELHKVQLEEIVREIEEKLIEKESRKKKEIIKQIELLIENYEIQMEYYSQKNYKQGFKDGLGLYNQCFKKE